MPVPLIAFVVVMIATIVTSIILWVKAIYGALTRTDLKENRWLWVALLLFFAPIGMVVYFFVENRKLQGIFVLVSFLIFLLGFRVFTLWL